MTKTAKICKFARHAFMWCVFWITILLAAPFAAISWCFVSGGQYVTNKIYKDDEA